MQLQNINEQFSIPSVLSFEETEHGLIKGIITSSTCSGEFYLHGAHLTRWQPTGQKPVLFLSKRSMFTHEKAIRGGIPVIFPWFGPRTTLPGMSRTDGPSHGFARTAEWTLLSAESVSGTVKIEMTLTPGEVSRSFGYDSFAVKYEILFGTELDLRFTVINQGLANLSFEEALHTYLAVGDVEKVSIEGLSDTDYLDKTDGAKLKHQKDSALTLKGETDRPYLSTTATVTVLDPTLKRDLVVSKSNSNTTVIWNPWSEQTAKLADMEPDEWRYMTCVESANVGGDAIVLPAGGAHTMHARISIEG